jgi:diol dehydratase reactivase alpha subunit
MAARSALGALRDVRGDPGTTVGAMFGCLMAEMAEATGRPAGEIATTDLLAVDFHAPQPVAGGLSQEVAPERAVALATMVESGTALSHELAAALAAEIGVPAEPGGAEAEAGIRGALTSPGAGLPLAVLDLGSGSTNAAYIDRDGRIRAIHLAGGGAMVNLLIGEELGIPDEAWREDLKRCRTAHAEGLFALRHEDGSLQFLAEPLPAHLFGRTVLLRDGVPHPVPGNPSLARVVEVRRRAKLRVFGVNALRGLRALAPAGNPRYIGFLALVGGSALDVELPGLLADLLAEFGIVTGAANVRGTLGPRNAVATGLLFTGTGATSA